MAEFGLLACFYFIICTIAQRDPFQWPLQYFLWCFQKHEFFVDMTCEGCSNAVTRVLNKLGGVQFEIDLPNKKVIVESDHSVNTLLDTLKKTGKNASYTGEK
uniref:Copper transport protein ATOX1 n=1 Tax=Anolis carolinensis TaxID=28377 RepID=A0A803SXP1_ANOCA